MCRSDRALASLGYLLELICVQLLWRISELSAVKTVLVRAGTVAVQVKFKCRGSV